MARVLVVEDDQDTRRLLRRWLEAEGHIVGEAGSVVSALAEARLERSFQLVVCDVLLPGAPGWDLIREMAADPALQAIPVLVVSITDMDDIPKDVRIARWIVKPFTRSQLLDAVDSVLVATSGDDGVPSGPAE